MSYPASSSELSTEASTVTVTNSVEAGDNDGEGDNEQGGISLSGAEWSRMPEDMIALCGTTLVVGFFSNLWVLYAGLRKKSLRNSSFHILLLNHTVLNLLLSMFIYPSLVFRLCVGLPRSTLEQKVCQYSTLCMLCFISVGLLTNAWMGINRALSCHPQFGLSAILRGKKATGVIVVVTWLSCFVIYVITAAMHPTSWTDTFMCTLPSDVIERAMLGVSLTNLEPISRITSEELVSLMVAALLLSVASYGVIMHHLMGQKSQSSIQRKRDKKRALVVIVLVFAVFLGCWLPLMMALVEDPYVVATQHVYLFLPMLESALNPLLYVLTMAAFRPNWCNKLLTRNAVDADASQSLEDTSPKE